ncbi:nucleotidyltransferase substrate-binding protein [Candidatus Omnitrophus magneticus]|uniref:Nucleotidyltransferase substrate-binding protein n=1 Tax=Candidatus Omnitrophus magneticus TaxID=1609969 RepID=A0A0F0CUU0_9BACT|nr:nucleotidyltransferase substrate-binding protein [Candidatus Omnitrophus magneticus]
MEEGLGLSFLDNYSEDTTMPLDLSSLQKAVSSMERAVKVADILIKGAVDTDQEEVIRAGVIQNFEFTYELCWKFMRRWLELNEGGQIVDKLTMKELFRMAAERQLIQDVEAWFRYHKARNQTSYIYDEIVATDVYETSVNFFKDAKLFLKTLGERND